MNFTEQETKLMRLKGLPGYILSEKEFRLEDYLTNYTSTLEGLKPLPVKKEQQFNHFREMMLDPVHAPYIACISSSPNDLRAKILASSIMQQCIKQGIEPYWHTVIGGYKDELRDNIQYWRRKLGLLIITNFTPDSTDAKYEKVRDLIEIYNDIPRIIVTAQAEPFSFFNAMGIPLHYGINVKSKRCNRTL